MSYKVEHLSSGEWYSEDLRFATADEAQAYAYGNPPYRVTPSDEPANYRFRDSRLVPGVMKSFDFAGCTWEEYVKGLGCLNPT
jgi:hypothetical protein